MSVLQDLVRNWPVLLAAVLGVAAFIELRRGDTVPALILGALALALVGIKVSWGMLIAIAALAFFLTWILAGKSLLGAFIAFLLGIVILRLAVPGLAWSGKEGVAEADSILGGAQVNFTAPSLAPGEPILLIAPVQPQQAQALPQGQACVTLEAATARTGPGSAYPQLPDVPSGTQVQVIARKADERGYAYNGSTERCLLSQPNAWVHCGVLSCTQTP